MQLFQSYPKQKGFAFLFVKAALCMVFGIPILSYSQEAGCFDSSVMYVKINTVPPPINATPASFGNCNNNYNYQWQVSTDDKYFIDIPDATGQNLNYIQPVNTTLYFLRKAKCGTTTKYTNSIIVYPVWKACTDFGLSLSGTSGNALATIKAGAITSTNNSAIGEFVIEWYRNVVDSVPEFVSGSAGATDPAVTVSHPFSGEPAEGGTWYPVIKYVYIDGVKYSRNRVPGARHSPDLLHCLDPIVVIVNNLNCANGGNVPNGMQYAHLVSYRNSLNSPTLASRSFRFDLDSVNKYFAWDFVGYQIADEIKITYVSPSNGNTQTVLEYWRVGGNTGSLNIGTSPKSTFYYSQAKITSLTAFTFAAGDYLKIEITPNANSNTDWDFYCKCISSPTCDVPTGAVRGIVQGSVSMTYDTASCSYEVQYELTSPYTGNYSSDFWRYHFKSQYYGYQGGTIGLETATIRKMKMQKRTDGTFYGVSSYIPGSCASMSGSAQVSKTGNVVTLVFSNSTDYNSYKNNYTQALANTNVANYSSDPASINYYKFWIIDIAVANSCGDATTRHQIWSHLSNPINFNDATLTISTTIASVTNGYVPSSNCDFVGQVTTSMVNSNNYLAGNNLNFSGTTNVKGGITCYYASALIRDDVDKRSKIWYMIPSADICGLSTLGWNTPTHNLWQWELVLVNDRVVITNTNDPIHNFRLERWMDANGNELTSNPIIIYEIVDGVVTVNRGFPL